MADSNDLVPLGTDPNEPLKAGLRYGLIGLGVLLAVGLVLWGSVSGTKGLWGVLIGAGVGGGFILTTVVLIWFSARRPVSQGFAIVMIGWFAKLLIVMAVMVVISRMSFYDKNALVFSLIGAIVLVLGGEVLGVMRTQVPYVDDVGDGERSN
ncbi:hypothetical protein ACHIPZ_05975 [Antrihabitans sp. NCIMB 15449]|uniref:ATP synthase protein I n=1 Tax=Antrihabitans spumae TaxID=3373370 RepID=A0ABW7JMF4_9NOCA